MNLPTLSNLPISPPGKTGFPWTSESPSINALTDILPLFSIVTPSYNQARFLEETIRSVLLQGYPNLEYIIIDGGSTDGSVDTICQYTPWLTYWSSERDQGQLDAISKGLLHSSGEIIAYLNSDDTYLPGTFARVARAFQADPDVAAICGGELLIDREGMVIAEHRVQSATWYDLVTCHFIPQPAIFIRRAAFERAEGFDPRYQIIFDFELWTRVVRIGKIKCIPDLLATTRWHSDTRTLTQRIKVGDELSQLIDRILADPAQYPLSFLQRRFVRARLDLTLVGIYLDNSPQSMGAAIQKMLATIYHWPPLFLTVLWILLSRLRGSYRAWRKHSGVRNPALLREHKGKHWSVWK